MGEGGLVHLKRLLGLVGVIAASTVLITSAGAGTSASSRVDLSTRSGVVKLLKSLGVNPKGVVIQRGLRNYAGPSCPGKAWKCTRARRVVQFAEGDGDNAFKCSSSYGTPSYGAPTPSSSPPDNCVIVQVNTNGNNNATCNESSSAANPFQECVVWQENASGNNKSKISQTIDQQDGQSQRGHQDATVNQFNGSGKNDSDLSQTIRQHTQAPGPSVAQSQDGEQTNSIDQEADTGAQNSSMSQSVKQLAKAGGGDGDHATLSSLASAKDDSGPVSGSQEQKGNGTSDTYQSSSGVSKSDNDQSMNQRELAPKDSTGLTQYQDGPFHCCSPQFGNPKDKFTLKQSKSQFASTLPQQHGMDNASQTFSLFQFCEGPCPSGQSIGETGFLESSGKASIDQTADQNGAHVTNHCTATGGFCEARVFCTDGACSPPFSCSTDNGSCGDSAIRMSAQEGVKAVVRLHPNRSARFKHHF
jgi:hypothetical protein